ncbi:MAG: hypothetical protein ABH871_04845 [Pseudomonadota bacterium]
MGDSFHVDTTGHIGGRYFSLGDEHIGEATFGLSLSPQFLITEHEDWSKGPAFELGPELRGLITSRPAVGWGVGMNLTYWLLVKGYKEAGWSESLKWIYSRLYAG